MTNALVLDGVTKRYPNGRGIKNVSFSVPKGEIFGFLGPNGAGKTTTIRTIMDFMRPDRGTITILDLDAQSSSVVAKSRIGYVPADRQLYANWTAEQHLNLYQSMRPKSKLDTAKQLDLDLLHLLSIYLPVISKNWRLHWRFVDSLNSLLWTSQQPALTHCFNRQSTRS